MTTTRVDRILEILDVGDQSTTPEHHGFPPTDELIEQFTLAFSIAVVVWQQALHAFLEGMIPVTEALTKAKEAAMKRESDA